MPTVQPATAAISLSRGDVTLVGERTGDGPPLVLLHAGREDRSVWRPVARGLADAGHGGVAYDQRGHGDSGGEDADALPAFAADVVAMIDALDAAPGVVGASLGGLAALHALGGPGVEDRVAGLVLVDVVHDPPRDATRRWLRPTLGAELADHPRVEDILSRAPALREAARRLAVPVLAVRGEKSPLEDSDFGRLTGLVPHAQVVVVPRAGHLVARDAPSELAALLVAFLRRPDVRRRRIDRFLTDAGADATEHPGGTLRAHLQRTGDTLRDWGAPAWLEDAGRVHAAYGTDGHPHSMGGARPATVRAVVGARSERLVGLYCRCDRARSYPTFLSDTPAIVDRDTGLATPLSAADLRAFAELTIANELDVLARAPDLAARHGAAAEALFRSWLPLVGEPARAAVRSRAAG